MTDEWMDKENDISKQLALSNQKNEFYNKRISELSDQMEQQSRTFEEKLTAKRDEIAKEMKESIARIKGERDLMEQRYEAKKRQVKDLENDYQSKINSLEKNSAVLQEKLTSVEAKKYELEKRLDSESTNIREELRRERELFE